MAIKFQCPECKKAFSIKDECGGRKARCPCGKKLMIPFATKPKIGKKLIPTTKQPRQEWRNQAPNGWKEHGTETRCPTSIQLSGIQNKLPPQKMSEQSKGKIITFKGRIGRARFALFIFCFYPLLGFVIGLVFRVFVLIIAVTIGVESLLSEFLFTFCIALTIVTLLIAYLWYLSLCWRRLHDIDKSGWHFLLLFIPIISLVIFAIMLVRKGTEGPNQYGPSPFSVKAGTN